MVSLRDCYGLLYLIAVGCILLLFSSWSMEYDIAHQMVDGSAKIVSLANNSSKRIVSSGIDDDYSTRLDRVKEYCKAKQNSSNMCLNGEKACVERALIFDENNKVMYCAIPKVATTIWKTNLALMTGKNVPGRTQIHTDKALKKYNIQRIYAYTKSERAYRMRHYFKFVFVRHPLTRLLSAYRHLIESRRKNVVSKRLLPFIMEHLRKNKTAKKSISFEEFTSYILRTEGKVELNRHWAPYNKLCFFCEIQYDFIGRQEFLEADTQHLLLSQFKGTHYADFNNSKHRTYSGLVMARKYYKQLSERTKKGLLSLYSEDMDMFGYKSSDIY